MDDADNLYGNSYELISNKAFENGVLAPFHVNGRLSAYARASFSLLSDVDIDEAVRTLAEAVRDVQSG